MSVFFNTKKLVRRKILSSLQPCQEIVPLLSASLDRPLSLIERLKLNLHLIACAWCSRYLRQIKLIRETLQAKTDELESYGEGLSTQGRERIRRSLQDRE